MPTSTSKSSFAGATAVVGPKEATDAGIVDRRRAARSGSGSGMTTSAGVADRVAARAEIDPEGPAVVDGSRTYTYRDLVTDVDALAARLVEAGVGLEVHVGMLLRRSYRLVVAQLAILRAGGAYVPLNPDLPEGRLAPLVSDVQPRVMLVDPAYDRLAADLRAGAPGAEIWPFPDSGLRSHVPGDGRSRPVGGRHTERATAYVMQTSGSTGVPKSVQVETRSLVNLLDWYVAVCEMAPGERVGHVIAPSFDASVKNFLAPLVCGATLVLFEDAGYDPRKMLSFLHRERVTILNPGVPSAVYPVVELAAEHDFSELKSLRMLALTGETPDLTRFRSFLDSSAGRVRVVDIYGPTECTDIASCAELDVVG